MITVACATDDKKTFSGGHFGEARFYMIFNVDKNGSEQVETIENVTLDYQETVKEHGDPMKAKHVMILLKEKNVQVLANKKFGPNIARIKIRFLPVIMNVESVQEGLEMIRENYDRIYGEYSKGVDRKQLRIEQGSVR
ncbi:MAG: NifB/NifX family molybdenum-iron cluster-binding protein [Spirochaetota bacterium]